MGNCVAAPTNTMMTRWSADRDAFARMPPQPEYRLLLLGAAGSGKTTLLKQMRLLYGSSFTPDEVDDFRGIIYGNLVIGMQSLITHVFELNLSLAEESMEYAREVYQSSWHISYPHVFQSCCLPLKKLWDDPRIQLAWRTFKEAIHCENFPYFFASLDRLCAPGYMPTNEDIMRCNIATTGMMESRFLIRNFRVAVLDVGGARSERKKWINYFLNVDFIFFLVSLSGYDQRLAENLHVNRMQEDMELWTSISRSKWFTGIPIVLFLNKYDIFEETVSYSSIQDFSPDYEGQVGDVRAGRHYFARLFSKLAGDREVYIQSDSDLVATDCAMVRTTMSATAGERAGSPFGE